MTSLTEAQGRRLALGAQITGAEWLGEAALFATGEGRIVSIGPMQGKSDFDIEAHEGAVLSLALHPNGEHLLTGGDDGKLMAVSADGEREELASFRGKWVSCLAASPASGAIAAGVGKDAVVFLDDEEAHRFAHPSSVGGLAFDSKGRRLAISHYGGVTLRYALAADDKGQVLAWKGSHLGVTISPDGAYVVSSMQENELHGWRMPEKTDLRMSGYSAKSRFLSWDKRGRWLATSGADCAVVWPFVGKLGPQGKSPLALMPREALVSAVAFHPSEEILAVGYVDGAVFAVRLSDQVVIKVDDPGAGAISALAWRADGNALAFGDEAGRAGVASLID